MNLPEMLFSLKKWLLLLGLGLLLGVAAGYAISEWQMPVYQADAKILVARTQQARSSDLVYLSDQQLIQTYIEVLKSASIYEVASQRLGFLVDDELVTVEQVPETQVIQVFVEDNDSLRAAQIANMLVNVLIERVGQEQAARYESYESVLVTQLDEVDSQISSLQQQIVTINAAGIQEQLEQASQQVAELEAKVIALETEISEFPPLLNSLQRTSLAEKQFQLERLRSQLGIYQGIEANLRYIGQSTPASATRDNSQIENLTQTLSLYQTLKLGLLNSLQTFQLTNLQDIQPVSVIDAAVPPVEPIRPLPIFYMALGGILGLVLSFGLVLTLGYFDNTIKFASDVSAVLGSTVLGTIPNKRRLKKEPVVLHLPHVPEAQTFRKLSAMLETGNGHAPLKTLVVTSAGRSEGTTTVAANLAAAYSLQGRKVLLVEANFAHPHLRKWLGLEPGQGFSDLLSGDMQVTPQRYQNGGNGGFLVLPCGDFLQPDSLCSPEKIAETLATLHQHADLIIIDAPPLTTAEANLIVSKADGVLLNMQAGHTRVDDAVSAVRQINLQGVPLLGMLLNRAG